MLGDVLALKALIAWKGHAGRKPCFRCSNLISKSYRGEGIPLTSIDWANMQQHTDESVRLTYQRIIDTKANGQAIAALETELGWSFSSYPLVMDTALFTRVISCVMFDWCHVYMVNGIVSVEIAYFVRDLWRTSRQRHRDPITYTHVHNYLQRWCWPRAHASPHNLCGASSAKSWMKNDTFGGTASEQLSFLPVFGRFVEVVVASTALGKVCERSVKSLLTLVVVVDLLHAIMRGATVHHTVMCDRTQRICPHSQTRMVRIQCFLNSIARYIYQIFFESTRRSSLAGRTNEGTKISRNTLLIERL